MIATTPAESPALASPRPLKLLRRCALIGWSSWLVCIGLLWGQHQIRARSAYRICYPGGALTTQSRFRTCIDRVPE
jgi:hypothetical protein